MKFTMLPTVWDETVAGLEAAGHEFVEDLAQARGLVFNAGPEKLPDPVPENIEVIQLPFAGVEPFNDAGLLAADGPRWANGAGLYADTVAESALSLLLAQLHLLKTAVNSASFDSADTIDAHKQWLFEDKTVAIIGAGGIGVRLLELLAPHRVSTIAVNRSGRPVTGADRTVAIDDAAMDEVWATADYFVLIMPLTDQTRHMVNADVLGKMKSTAVVVNVGRGPLIHTDDLLAALRDGTIAGAALDVTDPEPLPDDHPLWGLDNCLITPHVANTPSMVRALTGQQAVRNFDAFEAGETMPAEVDGKAGY